jgi:hypothetical protein
MCTTFTECKIVITIMLMVMSDMDPHMISRDAGWYVNGLDWIGGTKVSSSRSLRFGAGCHPV